MPATYELVPGKSIGPFLLGDSLWHILDLLRTQKQAYPKVDLAWDTSVHLSAISVTYKQLTGQKAHRTDLTITLPNLVLYFPHPSQRLAQLTITSLPTSSLTLSYESKVIRSSNQALTRGGVSRTLGPTYSGDNGSLSYPGIKFDIPSTNSSGSSSGREDTVQSLTVFPKEEGVLPEILPLASVTIQPNTGITLHVPHRIEVILGETTSQDLLLDLGAPLRKFVKEDDRMERIWGGEATGQKVNKGTFWNYFQYGIDFLISPAGLVAKIVIHSNIPGTPLFQCHARCPWSLPTDSGPLDHTSSIDSFRAHFSGEPVPSPAAEEIHLRVPTPGSSTAAGSGKKKNKQKGSTPSSLGDTSDTSDSKPASAKGESAKSAKDQDGDGMILDRVVEGGLEGVEGMAPSRLVGFEGLILEEDRGSGGISSVSVFRQV